MTTAPAVTISLPPPGIPDIALVCDSPHSGTFYPEDFGHAISHAALRQSEDTHVDTLWQQVPAMGGTLLCATFPRSYIDANRDEADIDLGMIGDAWPLPVRPSKRCLDLGIGLIWRETPERQPIYARKLSAHEVAQRIAHYWQPYRQALAQQLERAAQRHGGYWHLNLHSMPSNAYERLGLPPRPLADIVLGDRRGTSCGGAFVDVVAQAFRARGYSVAVNDPYEGVDLVRIAGAPVRGRHSLQVEINRAIYMHEPTRQPAAGFATLGADIARVLEEVRSFVTVQTAVLAAGHRQAASAP
jgi:N-formylglutamate deformylase